LGNVTLFDKIICPICESEVIQLSKNRIYKCCDRTFLAEPRADKFVIKEVKVRFCRTCKKASIIVKKVY